MSPTQSALVIPERYSSFKLTQIPVYTPGPGQLLIKIHAGALNPADWKIQKNILESDTIKYPVIPGLDRAGEVLEVGKGVEGFEKGDRVLSMTKFIDNTYSSFQQYSVTDAVITTKIPSDMSYEEATTIPLGLGTAFSSLFAEFPHGAGLPTPFTPEGQQAGAGKTIFIIGGSSSVGQYTIQLAKIAGFSNIVTTASLRNEILLKSQGATHVIDRSLEASVILKQISTLTSDHLVDVTFDAIGEPSTESLGVAVASHWNQKSAENGLFVSCLPQSSEFLKNQKNIRLASVLASYYLSWNTSSLTTLYHDVLHGWLKDGSIKPNRYEVIAGGLAGIPAALNRLENNEVSGAKLVFRPHETA